LQAVDDYAIGVVLCLQNDSGAFRGFEWDDVKNNQTRELRGFDFDAAARVFADHTSSNIPTNDAITANRETSLSVLLT